MKKLAPFTLVAGGVLLLDQVTKALVQQNFRLHESRPVIDGLFHLTYVRNPGAAFGIFSQHGEAFRRPFFIGITVLALVVIGIAARRLAAGRPWTLTALALVFGGAAGNLIDRVRWGEVVDFLDVFWKSHHWPAFNVADSAITVGMTLLVIVEIFGERASSPDRQKVERANGQHAE